MHEEMMDDLMTINFNLLTFKPNLFCLQSIFVQLKLAYLLAISRAIRLMAHKLWEHTFLAKVLCTGIKRTN